MSQSDSSSLSSVPSDDEDLSVRTINKDGILSFITFDGATDRTSASSKAISPARKREPSPPHEYVLADNPDIAFIVMFRSRFSDVFSKSLSHYGPQDIERGVVSTVPGEHVENLLCALLGLVLNRKKNPERGHFHRALEEAVSTHKSQWPRAWEGVNPLAGSKTFATMSPTERLTLLKTLIIWSLSASDLVQAKLKESFKQNRRDDDLNQPLSVQPWGRDGDKRRYWLIEGQDDTHFRLYRESNPVRVHNTWWSVAGSIEELTKISEQLTEDGSQAARRLSERITAAVPRFEATEEKRRRREYRQARKQQFTRPEPGFSMYEGRTRGKRMRYTYSDEEDEVSDEPFARRSTRNSGISTPGDVSEGPTFTASGRQVRSRVGGAYGETILSGQGADQSINGPSGAEQVGENDERPRRSGLRQEINGWAKGDDHIETYNSVDEMDDEEDAASSGADEYAGDYEDEGNGKAESEDEDEEMSGDDSEHEVREDRSLVVQLRVRSRGPDSSPIPAKSVVPEAAEVNGANDDSGFASLEHPQSINGESAAVKPEGKQHDTDNVIQPDLKVPAPNGHVSSMLNQQAEEQDEKPPVEQIAWVKVDQQSPT